jgi:hypothetical protein
LAICNFRYGHLGCGQVCVEIVVTNWCLVLLFVYMSRLH